ncbi:Las1-domain-containing protein [Amniculicola lignicola CBS 123094]|uniref:Las1-domain-containing protein n=1 Tax=Amniculicola lignicola CBS 123094 TaxID=1392246 RepID=A0A6A5WTB3_9PLEO|nr:Las1-domain-containing protein [Amniculicola lignicola CBS 123094]
MEGRDTKFVVTPWRDADELLQVRKDLYSRGSNDRREHGVDRVLAWRIRKQELPLLLESTADIVDAVLQDGKGWLQDNALKLVYAGAIARFVTGFSDTQLDLRRAKPSWIKIPTSEFLILPAHLLETRHRIVHRHLPSLLELKRAAQESLEWLWEWYWSQLDEAFAKREEKRENVEGFSSVETRSRMQTLLKSYVKDRKGEIKAKRAKTDDERQPHSASTTALNTYGSIDGSFKHLSTLLDLLIVDKTIIPADRKMGTSMSGAFLIWSPFLCGLIGSSQDLWQAFAQKAFAVLGAPSKGGDIEQDPNREAMHAWIINILTSEEWESKTQDERGYDTKRRITWTLEKCFIEPTYWNLKVAEGILKGGKVDDRKRWLKLLHAAMDENMDIDTSMETEVVEAMTSPKVEETVATTKGPGLQKKTGMWRPLPIGTLPVGWENDD